MKRFSIIISLLICSIIAQAQTVKNYFSIDSVLFDQENYFLTWSSFSNGGYYKQEYLRKGDYLDKGFNKMILIEVLQGNLTPKELATKKAKEVEERKKTDQIANYQIIDNPDTGEYLIDFLMSNREGDLYEFNIYRYKIIVTPKGKAVMLFGFCLRSFEGAELSLDDFFPYLKKHRIHLINQVTDYRLPVKFLNQY